LEFVNVFNKQLIDQQELQPLIKLLIIYLDMYVTVGKLGRNTIQVKSLVELQMDLQLHQLHGSKTAKPITHAKLQNCNWEHVYKSWAKIS
jgi:predicted HAD superfamily Cof-like phosphohydrolase